MDRSARLLLVVALCLGSVPVFGEELELVRAPFPYGGQTRFVTVPAQALSSPVQQVGFMAGALLCLPGTLYQEARRKEDIPFDKQPSIVCGRALGTGLGWPAYAAIGLPFFILQKVFWDAPRAVAGLFK